MDSASQLLLVLLVLTPLNLASPVNARRSRAHVVTTYEELKLDIQEFDARNPTGNYSVMVLKNDKIIVGSRDYISSIQLADFSQYEMQYWKPEGDGGRCAVNGCPNFVKVLLKYSDKLFVCGTNGNAPVCSWRNLPDLSQVSSGAKDGDVKFKAYISANSLIPNDPNVLNTAVMTETGQYFYALPRGPKWRLISYDFGSEVVLSTLEEWFSKAEFVKSFDIGQYVYFFFHEDAEEYTECGKRRIPRVARLCKGDEGGVAFLNRKFVTFNKATLSCSIAGDYPFNFNEVQDVVWNANSSVFDVVFTTQQHQSPRSAICSFSLEKIEEVFGGDFKYQENSKTMWKSVTNPLYFPKCSTKPGITTRSDVEQGKMPTKYLTMDALVTCKKYQLMNFAVQPIRGPFVHDGVKFTGLAVDSIGGHNIYYVATDRGSVLKIFNSCILEEINVFPTGAAERIKKLQLDVQRKVLYIGSDSKLLKLWLERCSSHGSKKRTCLEAADPYCGWDRLQQQCVSVRGSQNNLKQNLTLCPVPKDKWSEWSTCQQADGNLCRCRTRPCAASNASSCHSGMELQLRNCTVDWDVNRDVEAEWVKQGVQHGGWSVWSDWSACSVTLGTGHMIRSRTCTSPPPSRGGRACTGLSHDSKSCTRNPSVQEKKKSQWTELGMQLDQKYTAVQYEVTCRAVGYDLANISVSVTSNRTVDCTQNKELCKEGRWDEWQSWGECVRVGTRKRRRQCLEPPCLGVDEEQQVCTPPFPTQATTTGRTTAKAVDPPVVDRSWGEWSSCECQSSTKLLIQNDYKSLGLQYRFPKCREMCPVSKNCPKDDVDFRTCLCDNSKTSVSGYKQSSEKSYSLELLIGVVVAAVVFSLLCIAISLFCVRRRKKNDFNVSRASQKNDDVFINNSKYHSTPKRESDNSRSGDKYDRVCMDESRYTNIELKGGSTSSDSSRSKDDNKNSKQHTRVSWSPQRIKNYICRPKDWTGSQEMI